MIAYRGRSSHKVKLPNKPIKEGYKVWVLDDAGYVYDWLWHSRVEGLEDIPQEDIEVKRVTKKELTELNTIQLAPTFAFVIRLVQRLRQMRSTCVFYFFLDNLFLNINVAQSLLALRICCTDTIRKNAQGIPTWILTLKEHNRGLVWNSMFAEVVDNMLVFLWQDNNAVIGCTTAHSLKNDTVLRLRRRLSSTSTNARIVRPVFGDLPFKWLHIPRAIDDYNHYMNDVDRSNQLRKNFTAHRPYERRVWRPLWYYILDICVVNNYLLWKGDKADIKKRGQCPFRKALIDALLNTSYPLLVPVKQLYKSPPTTLPNRATLDHCWQPLEKRGYCVWCRKSAQEEQKKINRPALAEVVNCGTRKRTKLSYGGCRSCNVYLCVKGPCFEQYHCQ